MTRLKRLNPFTDKEYLSRLMRLTWPMVLQYLMLAAVAVSDAFMLGSMEQNAMSAVSLATQIQFIQNVILGSMTAAVSVLTAQYWGKKDTGTVQEIMAIGVRIGSLISVVFAIGCVFFPSALMSIFTDSQVLIDIGQEYLRIAGVSYLLTGITQPIMTVIKATGHPKQTAKISSCTVILNVVLNAVLIFGLFGMPAMGVAGAAAATLISRAFEFVWVLLTVRRDGYVSFQPKKMFVRNPLLSKDFFKCMMPLVGAGLFWGLGFVSYSAFMGHMGTDAVAANSVAAVVRDIVCCLCDGLAAGGGVLVGNELGAGHLEQGKLYGNRTTVLAYIIGFVSALLMLAATPVVVHLVRLTEGASEYLYGMMFIISVYMIGRAVNTVIINGIFAAGGDTMFDMYSLAVTMWGLAVPLAFLGTFVFHWPPLLVYAFTCLDEVGKIPWVMIHYRKYKWVKDLTREFN